MQRGDQDVPISSHIHRDGLLYSKSSAEMEDLQLIYADLKAINSLVSGKPINDDRSMVMPPLGRKCFILPFFSSPHEVSASSPV